LHIFEVLPTKSAILPHITAAFWMNHKGDLLKIKPVNAYSIAVMGLPANIGQCPFNNSCPELT
jgi:hypothetical protein